MRKILNRQFVNLRNKLDDKNYLFTTIAYFIAPTITKEKPSSLITFTKNHRNSLLLWKEYKNELLEISNIQYYEIKKTKDSTLVLFYDPEQISKVLLQKEHIDFLKKFGYSDSMNLTQLLNILKMRFFEEFPHEIGIFLGFPLLDIISFIENKGKNYLLCKYWKVYHNPQKAKNIFYNFDRSRFKVLKLLANGVEPLKIIKSSNLIFNEIA